MKKILLTLAIAFATLSYGQRVADISVNMTAPTAATKIRTGVPFNFTFWIKNNGPSVIKTTDTLAFFMGAGSSVFLATQTLLPKLSADLAMGDSTQFTVQNMSLSGGNGSQLPVCAFAVLINRALPDSVTDNNLTEVNNRSCVVVTYSGVGIGEIRANQFTTSSYPNPAADMMTIEFNSGSNQSIVTEIYDMQGKLVNSISSVTAEEGTQYVQLNVNDLNKGFYFYKVINSSNGQISSSKFVVE